MTTFNKIAAAHLDAEEKRGTVAQLIRKAVTGKQWEQVGEAYGQLLESFGKRSRIKGTKEFTPSTPADTFNTQIQTVTSDMDCGKLRPVLIELEDGSEKWGLQPVESKAGSKRTTKKLVDVREAHAALMEGRTYDEKMSEVIAFAELMGVKLDRDNVTEIKPKAKGKKAQPVPMSAGQALAANRVH